MSLIIDNTRPFCRVAYWKGNTRCFKPAEWDHCTVTPSGPSSWGEQTFTRENEHKIPALLAFLDMAFNAGREYAKAEIRNVLGVR